ncbi:hypothetical protein QAD02_022803 [Eretmocerus hayati]|uniref:Uncharacterized protein n=1 Tax=Eretmocerus hayati TaxID=131215 RepID=A0ACC2PTS9_9HYME|nr:hypothetical protein QAD02_022803 [Eretmocerus hayati]
MISDEKLTQYNSVEEKFTRERKQECRALWNSRGKNRCKQISYGREKRKMKRREGVVDGNKFRVYSEGGNEACRATNGFPLATATVAIASCISDMSKTGEILIV